MTMRHNWGDAAYYEERVREQIRRDQEFWARQAEQEPCTRCGHRKDYHATEMVGHCGVDVCATGPHGGGGYCDNEMHDNGYCQCPSWVSESTDDED